MQFSGAGGFWSIGLKPRFYAVSYQLCQPLLLSSANDGWPIVESGRVCYEGHPQQLILVLLGCPRRRGVEG